MVFHGFEKVKGISSDLTIEFYDQFYQTAIWREYEFMTLIATVGKTDVGLKRTNNEDAFHENAEQGYCVLADGMGGAAAGELASQIFVETAKNLLSIPGILDEEKALTLVRDAFHDANSRILAHVQYNADHRGMGCTAELIVFHSDGFVSGHIGDSRTYRLRNGTLRQVTRDHSLVQDQLDQGLITSAEASVHPYRNIISRAVGTGSHVELDITRGPTQPGDLFLLCSDGLTDMVSDTEIESILNLEEPLPQRIDRLIQAAKNGGGKDNITVVIAKVL